MAHFQKLFMLLIGCKPSGRNTEQHDIFFGIGQNLSAVLTQVSAWWPEAENRIHIDAWREVRAVDGYSIHVMSRKHKPPLMTEQKLFFINLGGYKKNEFDEFHYKKLVVAPDLAGAIKIAKETTFYKHTGFENAPSHVDDKYGLDVDDAYEIEDILPLSLKHDFTLHVSPSDQESTDELHLGYFKFSKIVKDGL